MLKMPEYEPTYENYVNSLPEGVGAALTINTGTRAMQKFFGNLPPHYGTPISPDSAHVTLVDARDSAIPIQSERDLISLRKTGSEMHRKLASLPLQELVLQPQGDELEPFGRYLAIPLRNTPFMQMLRSDLTEIVYDGLGVELTPNIDLHMSVVRKDRSRIRALDNVPPFPANLHVNGFDMQRRVVGKQQGSPSRKDRYHNVPSKSRLRAV